MKTATGLVVVVKSCRFIPCKRPRRGSRVKCCTTYQMVSYHMLHIRDGSGRSLLEILVALFGFLHLVDSVPQVLLQPPDLWVHTHLFVCLQLGNHLEGAVRRVDEPEFSDVAPWEAVDG